MNSTVPLQVSDDDDGFDWEAAVREIDASCQNGKPPSTSSSTPNCLPFNLTQPNCLIRNSNNVPSVKKGFENRKQTTLDQFICSAVPNRRTEDHTVADEGVPLVSLDTEAAKTWIYPVNIPYREYQFAITKTALFSNTLVALPTGLGKTLIAAVVMYNYFRWFPDGKIVFTAPSRPLVMQQIEACHNVVGIPQEWAIDMTGQVSPTRRAGFWKEKRVFFVTPQVLEKDIQSGTCPVNYLVCLVVDEAHRALGNYSYSVAVRELMAASVQLRILSLTATPGSKQQSIQQVINNLHISKLEYRSEDDPDVSPYVHNRSLELIEVPLGEDADGINTRLWEVIRPYVSRLSAFGLLQNRDYQTLSPCDLLNSRDKFRQAPRQDLPHSKIGEFEAYFGVLITLYHIRKLLASHGIRPAYEMLEEKLKQGSFARVVSNNEDLKRTKLLMQQSLSHGAPSPKLSKMLEVLVDHFKAKDPHNSRAIIFSNFRGSVRDIMNALGNIGPAVKATEFIGQSSGKTLKGQSQKVQQAVLQKFRAGGYNVIVATSIGEEGLDIVEVDLVICFDANISPLRMIQRMGRTGRKNDGRVIVLACEGSELKGYMRKQANSTSIKKHMRHGGRNSFEFHSSPRMIPHIYKPEVQRVKLSIEEFVLRGKKVKDDDVSIQEPLFKEKLTIAESDSIAKYFLPNSENNWRPSLIAFPHFQAFPSRVHKVNHSYRTGMLIETMQELFGLSFSRDKGNSHIEDEVSSDNCLEIGIIRDEENNREDFSSPDKSLDFCSQKSASDSDVSPTKSLRTAENNSPPDVHDLIYPAHCYLFASDFISIDVLGKVLITSVPVLPFKGIPHSLLTNTSPVVSLKHSKKNSSHSDDFSKGDEEILLQANDSEAKSCSQTKCITNGILQISKLSNYSGQQEELIDEVETVPESPLSESNFSDEEECAAEFDSNKIQALSPLRDVCRNNFRDAELSPRLSNMMKIGILPESFISETDILRYKQRNDECLVPDVVSTPPTEPLLLKSPSPVKKEENNLESTAYRRTLLVSLVDGEIQTPSHRMNSIAETGGCTTSDFPVCTRFQTPVPNHTNSSNSKEWHLSSGGQSENFERTHKFKRLCKIGDHGKDRNSCMERKFVVPIENLARSFSGTSPNQIKRKRGRRKQVVDIQDFIEDEAEVSSDAEVSAEEDDLDRDSYDDSFIDDRVNPTAATTQAEGGRVDMISIYRRSLLSQSPVQPMPNTSAITPDSVASVISTNQTGSLPTCSLEAPRTNSANGSSSKPFAQVMTCIANSEKESEGLDLRKRKLSFEQLGSSPPSKLSLLSRVEDKGESRVNENGMSYDDEFYENIDFDALEAQASLLVKHKSKKNFPESNKPTPCLNTSPSFDLGI